MNNCGINCIELSGKHGKGKVAIVDADTFEKYGHLRWHLSNWGYAMRRVGGRNTPKKTILLHRLVMDAKSGEIVDHRNRNKLDNRRINLRICSISENNRNRSGVKGYTFDKLHKRWVVRFNKKFISYCDSEEEAQKLYKRVKSGFNLIKRQKRLNLPKNISLQNKKLLVSVTINGNRKRAIVDTLDEAIRRRDYWLKERNNK